MNKTMNRKIATAEYCFDYETLVNTTHDYMEDAGFSRNLYKINKLEDRYYLEILGLSKEAIEFILNDLKKTNFYDILEMKEYINEKNCHLIVTLTI